MTKARKTADENEQPVEQQEPSEQAQREAAREAAGQANQDQENAPAVEQTPQPDTQHFIAQPDVLNEPAADDSSDNRREGNSGE